MRVAIGNNIFSGNAGATVAIGIMFNGIAITYNGTTITYNS